MKKFFVVTVLIFAIVQLFAVDSGTGIGVIAGEPTGISVKLWQNSIFAYDAAAAWSFGDEGSLHLHADMLWHNTTLINSQFPIYYGLGARVNLQDDLRAGIRIPVGIAYNVQSMPLDIFWEIVPVLDIMPDIGLGFNGAIGVRYYF